MLREAFGLGGSGSPAVPGYPHPGEPLSGRRSQAGRTSATFERDLLGAEGDEEMGASAEVGSYDGGHESLEEQGRGGAELDGVHRRRGLRSATVWICCSFGLRGQV